jgi:hypothetical protein
MTVSHSSLVYAGSLSQWVEKNRYRTENMLPSPGIASFKKRTLLPLDLQN